MLTDFSFYGNIIAMKKIKLFSSLFLLTALFFSCSNASSSKIITSDGNNLREAIQNKESSVNWTKPLEENRLSEPIDKNDKLTSSVKINTEIMMVLKSDFPPVYPYIENFESLDIRDMQPIWNDIIKKLFEVLNTDLNKLPENMIDSKYIFNYVFFVYDLKTQWKENFKEDFKSEKAFSSYIIGKPFISDDIVQIPVRLTAEKGTVSLMVYIRNDGKYLINQIEIKRWD